MKLGFNEFGTRPGREYDDVLKASPQFNPVTREFDNRRPGLMKVMRKRAFTFSVMLEFLRKGENRAPLKPLPEVKPDLKEFMEPSDDLKVIWFGHSSFLLNFSGTTILVDPVFSSSAAPFDFAVRRFQKPALALSELPPIDYVLISHDHYDHLDRETVLFFKDKKAAFITALGVGSHMVGWGIDRKRITELDWWQKLAVPGLEFIATPAQHFSGRGALHSNSTLWASWVLRNEKHNIYFSGDSGYDTHFKDIGDKYGPFDLAFVESGQYNEKWAEVHLLPEFFHQTYLDLRATRYFPVHWGMFELSLHTWYDPAVRLGVLAKEKGMNLVTPILGEIVVVNDRYVNKPWWTDFVAES